MMKTKLRFFKRYGLLFCLLAIPVFLPAQTAVEIETLLNTTAVTYGQAARFTLEAADVLATPSREEAFNYALGQGWLRGDISSGDTARLDQISLLLMRSFGIKGGIMYSLFGSPHYAYRELVYKKVIHGRASPVMPVSGERLLFFVNRLLPPDPQDGFAPHRQGLAEEIDHVIEEHQIADTRVELTNRGITIIFSDIMFEADSVVLTDSQRAKIYEVARVLGAIPNVKLYITGHSTDAGSQEYLVSLSRRRAQSVADYLILLGVVRPENVFTSGYGSSRPLADNSTPEGMAANRRVEITIMEN